MSEQLTRQLEKLNRFTRRKHTADEVYLFDLILCDNDIDRDGDCFSEAALAALQKRFIGVTGIFDHDPRCGNQTARIFDTEICTDTARTTAYGKPYRYLKAAAYMVRTQQNADLIREIDGGIKKEVSISCAASSRVCSICGTNRLQKPCGHIQGRRYADALCYCVLDGITDAYEWSFVAVPAQKNAGVTKRMGGSANGETLALRSALDAAHRTLDALTEDLRKQVVRLCYAEGETLCAKALADSTLHLDADRLLHLRHALEIGKAHSTPQLSADTEHTASPAGDMTPFRLGKKPRERDRA